MGHEEHTKGEVGKQNGWKNDQQCVVKGRTAKPHRILHQCPRFAGKCVVEVGFQVDTDFSNTVLLVRRPGSVLGGLGFGGFTGLWFGGLGFRVSGFRVQGQHMFIPERAFLVKATQYPCRQSNTRPLTRIMLRI